MHNALLIGHHNGRLSQLEIISNFLKLHNYNVGYILHPLDDYIAFNTECSDFHGNIRTIPRKNRRVFNYLGDIYLSIRYTRGHHLTIVVSTTNLDTIPAIICRKVMGEKIDKIIYYPRDYSENRFKNQLLNKLYEHTERIAIKHADIVVSNTKRAEKKRISLGLNSRKSIVIPNGVSYPIDKFIAKKISKDKFIYVGDVSNEHGLYDLIQILSPYIKKLVIIGSGNEWNKTIALAKNQKFELETHYNKKISFVLDYLQNFEGFGLAPYTNNSDWTYYASPLKVSEYIACGVPVIMSDVPEISKTVRGRSLGVVYNEMDAQSIYQQVLNFNTENYNKKSQAFYATHRVNSLLESLNV